MSQKLNTLGILFYLAKQAVRTDRTEVRLECWNLVLSIGVAGRGMERPLIPGAVLSAALEAAVYPKSRLFTTYPFSHMI